MISAFFISLKKYAVGMTAVFFLIALLVTVTSLCRSSRRSPMFQAGARINIPEITKEKSTGQQSDKAGPGTLPPNSAGQDNTKGVTLQTAVEILQGNVLAEQVVTAIGIIKIFPDLDQETLSEDNVLSHALAAFQQQLKVTPIKDTRIIQMTFQHPNAAMSVQVIETLLQLFRKEAEKLLPSQEAWKNETIRLANQQMRQAVQPLSIMLQQKNRFLLAAENQETITAQYDKIKTQLSTEQENLHEQLNRLNTLEEQYAAVLKPENQDNQTEQTEQAEQVDDQSDEQTKKEQFEEERKDLLRLKIYEQDLREKYGKGGSGDRLIANVRLQITSLENKLSAEAGIPAAARKELEETTDQLVLAQISCRRQQEKTDLLQRQAGQLKNTLDQLVQQEGAPAELRQQAETAQKRYATLVEQLEAEQKSSRVSQGSEQFQIIQQPAIPSEPIKPKKASALLLALLSGLIGSLLYGTIRTLRN
ncbi:MAG: GNVR domain-containing protein [Candidatus Electrothrix sp. Rat3]|nr:GNVR domain-containing protein [Candidatus Electrothrix rattekaaiensis]